jgi:hypothetical protein
MLATPLICNAAQQILRKAFLLDSTFAPTGLLLDGDQVFAGLKLCFFNSFPRLLVRPTTCSGKPTAGNGLPCG